MTDGTQQLKSALEAGVSTDEIVRIFEGVIQRHQSAMDGDIRRQITDLSDKFDEFRNEIRSMVDGSGATTGLKAQVHSNTSRINSLEEHRRNASTRGFAVGLTAISAAAVSLFTLLRETIVGKN